MLQRLSAGRQSGLGELVLLHAVDEGRAGDAEQARGLRLVAAGLLESDLKATAFGFSDGSSPPQSSDFV